MFLEKSPKRYKKQVNATWRKIGYDMDQKILLNVKNSTMLECLLPKFMSKFAGMFLFIERVFKDVYKLELPPNINVHPSFHVSLLKPFKEHTIWTGCK